MPIWYRPDPALGWVPRPNFAGWFTKEGRAFVSVNSAGLRDAEHTPDKPAGVYRIAVLGDSYSEAMQVPVERAYWALLPKRLEACGFQPGKRIEVLNFGVSGYGTAQEYVMLRSRAVRYQPDLVLLQFTNGNDVKDNSFVLEEDRNRPFFRYKQGKLVMDSSFAASPSFHNRTSETFGLLRELADHSRLVQLARAMRERWRTAPAGAQPAGIEEGLDRAPLTPPRDARWDEAWRITEALILSIRDYAERHGARFMMMSVPFAIQVHPDAQLREALRAKLGVPDLFYPDRRLAEFAKRSGVLIVPLSPEMQRYAQATGTFLHGFPDGRPGFGHWNQAGHDLAATLIARQLCGQ